MYYEVWQSTRDYLWYWHLKATNNEIIAQGEGYTSKAGALHAVTLVKASYSAPVYER
jgi:uncharacterized protein YegP (UPF0339 family)